MTKINKAEAERLFLTIRKEKGNDRCFDCGRNGPTWISVRHAVFVCTSCATRHRAIGLRLKSVLLDTFDKEDFKRIRIGGNFRFEEADFERRYERLGGYPKKLDRLVVTSTDAFPDVPEGERPTKLVVKQKVVPKFGKKVDFVQRRAEEVVAEKKKTVSEVKRASVERKGLLINRKEYKIGETSINRMGFGASKIKKTEEDAE